MVKANRYIYENFTTGEPNNWNDEDCAFISKDDLKMYDVACSMEYFCQVCNVSKEVLCTVHIQEYS